MQQKEKQICFKWKYSNKQLFASEKFDIRIYLVFIDKF